jgi:hypothetical protein
MAKAHEVLYGGLTYLILHGEDKTPKIMGSVGEGTLEVSGYPIVGTFKERFCNPRV